MKTKRFLSLVLAFAMVLTMGCMTAFAADGDEGATKYDLSEAYLTKDLKVADGIDISVVNKFTFSFTAVGTDTALVGDHPAISNQEITVGTQSDDHAKGKKALSEIFSISDFPHAGEFQYTVKETTEAIVGAQENGVSRSLTVDSSEYTVRLYVVNDGDALKFSGVTVEKDGEKVDPQITEEELSGFIFNNEYKEELASEDGVLTVTKSITGDYADKTKEFPITVELTLPSTAAEADVALAEGSAATLSGTTATANLADGGEIKFAKLPAGTTFVVKETQESAYKSKVTGDVKTVDTAYVEGNVEKEGKAPITESASVAIENNREDVIPTGVVINNLPYAILVALAAAGIVFFGMKRRNRI